MVSEIVKHKIKNKKGGFLGSMLAHVAASLPAPMVSSLIQTVSSSLINDLSGSYEKGVMRARKGEKVGFLALLPLPSIIKVMF